MIDFVAFTTALPKEKPVQDGTIIRVNPEQRAYYYTDYKGKVRFLSDLSEIKRSKRLKVSKILVSNTGEMGLRESNRKVCSVQKEVVVYFDFDKFNLKPSEKVKIDKAFKEIKNGKLKVYVSGYTDKVGSKEYNDVLAFKRARTVKKYIESRYTKDVCIKKAEGKCCYVSNIDALNRRAVVEITTNCRNKD